MCPIRCSGEASGRLEVVLHVDPVELHPDVLPGVVEVRHVGVDLVGKDEEPLALAEAVVGLGSAVARRHEQAAAGDDVVEEEVAAPRGTEGMAGRAGLAAVLIRHQVDVVAAGKRGELELVCGHVSPLSHLGPGADRSRLCSMTHFA